jgi:hypothetical protein
MLLCTTVTSIYKFEVKTSSRTCIHAWPRALWLRTSPPCEDGLWRCHESYGFGPRLVTEVRSGVATCPAAPNLIFRLRWDLTLPRVIWLRTSPLSWCGLRHCHVSCGSLWATSLKHKEKSSKPACVARHICSQWTCVCFQGAWHQGHLGSVRRAGRKRSQCLQGIHTCNYSATTVQH